MNRAKKIDSKNILKECIFKDAFTLIDYCRITCACLSGAQRAAKEYDWAEPYTLVQMKTISDNAAEGGKYKKAFAELVELTETENN